MFFKKSSLHISRKNVNVDRNLGEILLNHYLSIPYVKTPHNIIHNYQTNRENNQK